MIAALQRRVLVLALLGTLPIAASPQHDPGLNFKLTDESVYLLQTYVSRRMLWDDAAKLLPVSREHLDSIAAFFLDHGNVLFEVGVHTDSRGSHGHLSQLSRYRARLISEYLISTGVDSDRIRYAGYGGSIPLMTKEMIDDMPLEEERESAHARNRRIEFRIIGFNALFIQGRVSDRATGFALPGARVHFVDTYGESLSTLTDSAGNYKLYIDTGKDYRADFFRSEYLNETHVVSSQAMHRDRLTIDVGLAKAMCINNETVCVDFEKGSTRVEHADSVCMQELLLFLRVNPQVVIALRSHCDHNERSGIALKRGKKIRTYLVGHGIDSGRVSVESFGSRKSLFSRRDIRMLSSSERKNARRTNRRVCVSVVRDDYPVSE